MSTVLRYVILRHENIDAPHFDLMFETTPGGELATWRSEVWPIGEPTPLVRLANHRRDYLTYEGPLTSHRGTVRRIESGTFVRRTQSAAQLQLELTWGDGRRAIELNLDSARGEPNWTVRPV